MIWHWKSEPKVVSVSQTYLTHLKSSSVVYDFGDADQFEHILIHAVIINHHICSKSFSLMVYITSPFQLSIASKFHMYLDDKVVQITVWLYAIYLACTVMKCIENFQFYLTARQRLDPVLNTT